MVIDPKMLRHLRPISVRWRILASWLLASLLIGGVGSIGLMQLGAVGRMTTIFMDSWLEQHRTLDRLRDGLNSHKLLAQRQLETVSFRRLAEIQRAVAVNVQAVVLEHEALQHLLHSSDHRELLVTFNENWIAYLSAVSDAVRASESGRLIENAARLERIVQPAHERTLNTLVQLETELEKSLVELRQSAAEQHGSAVRLVTALTVLSLIATALGSSWIKRSITGPIIRVSQDMEKLTLDAVGAAPPTDRERSDEIGVLMRSVEAFRHSRERELELAERVDRERAHLDAAIENMPMGLAMLDRQAQVTVHNERFLIMYGLTAAVLAQKGHARSLYELLAGRRLIDAEAAESLRVALASADADAEASFQVNLDVAGERKFQIKIRPMRGGGWVTTHEDVTEQRKAEERIHHLSFHDGLTNLPNRRLYLERCEHFVRESHDGRRGAIVALDLDRFKPVNDTLGHAAGDELLKCVADRLLSIIRASDIASRFGGDEFVLLLSDVGAAGDVLSVTDRILAALSAPYEISGKIVRIGASIGIALVPEHGTEVEPLLKRADQALYQAKADGRGVSRVFHPDMDPEVEKADDLVTDLRTAIVREEFTVHYQPVVDLAGMKVSGFEALIRWHHPSRGFVPPLDFIRLAEDIGEIDRIGAWLLRRACQDAASWPSHLKLAINLSPMQFWRGDLIGDIRAALAELGMEPGRLEVEITEGLLLRRDDVVMSRLHELRDLGVRIAMDDFGTGYSSLSYVRTFPFDTLKIDRTFVRDLAINSHAQAIVDTTIRLATRLGMSVVAEGVETEQQFNYLVGQSCTHAQGYLFAEPQPAAAVPHMLMSVAETMRAARARANLPKPPDVRVA